MKNQRKLYGIGVFANLIFLINSMSCRDFIEIPPPRTDLIRSTVFEGDATALSAADDMYGQMLIGGFGGGFTYSYTFLGALSADELINFISWDLDFVQFNECAISPRNSNLAYLWDEPYKIIYRANALFEGLSNAQNISQALSQQLIGEALFVRSFCYFYLVNLFGDVPLVLTTDYETNAALARAPTEVVYGQIIRDLLAARDLLSSNYASSLSERVRPNSGTVCALLARCYLYTGEWQKAEQESSLLIENSTLYSLEAVGNVFFKQSKEAIWQIGKITGNANEGFLFDFPISFNCSLTSEFVASFEPGDERKSIWIRVENFGDDYFYPIKYYTPSTTPIIKHSIVLRLAEQYLIRAEARARSGDANGAKDDINAIRNRAGLENTAASDLPSLLLAIEEERRHELFTEWGDRWLDLKRNNRLDAVVGPLKPGWQPYKQLYPIPESQILNAPAMHDAQNPGYEQ